jgi:hypothetical protein
MKCNPDTGDKIEYYRTLKEALKNNNINAKSGSALSLCANGKLNVAHGFKWIYDKNKFIDIKKDSFENEQWKLIYNDYLISTYGRIINIQKKNKLLTPYIHNGYYMCKLKTSEHFLHRLIAHAFILNPNNYNTVNHINGNKLDNSIPNLEWTTQQGNVIHAIKSGLCKKIKKIVHYDDENNIMAIYDSLNDALKILNISYYTVYAICEGYCYKCDENNMQINLKFLSPTDDLINKKIDVSTKPILTNNHNEIRRVKSDNLHKGKRKK